MALRLSSRERLIQIGADEDFLGSHPYFGILKKRPIDDRRTSSQILVRFSTHDLRAENSIRFLGIALDWMMAVEMASRAAHQSNVF